MILDLAGKPVPRLDQLVQGLRNQAISMTGRFVHTGDQRKSLQNGTIGGGTQSALMNRLSNSQLM